MKRNRLIILLLIILSGTFASFYGGSAAYSVFFFFLILPVVSILYTLYVYIRFKVYQTVESKVVVKEEKIPYQFILSNEDFITFTNVRVDFITDESTVENISVDKDYCLLPSDTVSIDTTLCCHYRGEYKVGIKSVVVTDFFNIFKINYPALSTINMRVLPRIVDITKPAFMPLDEDVKNSDYSASTRQEFPDIDMRKYVKGDSRKMIHWKASAKKNELFSRRYYDKTKSEAVFVLDLKKIEDTELNTLVYEDKMIEAILAAAKYYVTQGMPLRMIYDDTKLTNVVIKNKSDFDALYNASASIKFRAKSDVSELVKESLPYLGKRGFCLIVTRELTENLAGVLSSAAEIGNDVTLILLNDKEQSYSDKKVKCIRIPSDVSVLDALSMS